MAFSDWSRAEIDPLAIQLDDQNPRLAASGLSQEAIRELLLKHEDVAKLAHSIAKNDGLYPHDLLIISDIGGVSTVLEGNRRIAALQMLINPNLIPAAFKDKVPRLEETARKALRKIETVVAPDRKSADHLIAQIHAFSARKSWSPLAKYRYAYSRFAEGLSVEDIAQDLGTDASEVRRFIRRYNIYKEVLGLKWTDAEKSTLRGEELQIYPFIYPFERKEIIALIGSVFDTEGTRNPKYKKPIVDRALKKLAVDALIPQSATGKPRLSTRGTSTGSIEDYFKSEQQELIAEATRLAAKPPSKPAPKPTPAPTPAPKPKPTTPKPDEFFETFSVPNTVDQKIVRLAWEIAHIDYLKLPVASAMLLRALLEAVLGEQLHRSGKLAAFKAKYGVNDGLKAMILFSAEAKNGVLKDLKIAAQLSRFQNSAVKDDLDNVVHNRYGAISAEGLRTIKPWVRPIIENIVRDEWA